MRDSCRFKSCPAYHGGLAKLAKASALGAEISGFESPVPYQFMTAGGVESRHAGFDGQVGELVGIPNRRRFDPCHCPSFGVRHTRDTVLHSKSRSDKGWSSRECPSLSRSSARPRGRQFMLVMGLKGNRRISAAPIWLHRSGACRKHGDSPPLNLAGDAPHVPQFFGERNEE